MSTRQYIGARYVPMFFENSATGDSTWAANTSYEPLTVVTWNGNSYTSKKNVPASVGNPSANSEYWASTGLYNAQVEVIREELEETKDDLNSLETQVTSDITTINSNITTLDNKIDTIADGDVLFIGDSYISSYNQNWATYLAPYLGKTIGTNAFISARSGCGFSYTVDGVNFATLVNSAAVDDVNNIKTIIFGGGANDIYNDAIEGIVTGIHNAVVNARTRFPNAKIYVTNNNAWINSGFDSARYIALNNYYQRGCIENDATFLGASANRLKINYANLLLADQKHPSTLGMEVMAKEIYCALSGHEYKDTAFNMDGLFCTLSGDNLFVNVYNQKGINVDTDSSYTANGNTYFNLPTTNCGLIGHTYTRRFTCPCYIRYNGSNYTDATLIVEFGTTGLRGAILKLNDAKTNFETITNLSQVTLLSGTTFKIGRAHV